jgi:hypothetical protein
MCPADQDSYYAAETGKMPPAATGRHRPATERIEEAAGKSAYRGRLPLFSFNGKP